MPLAFWPQAQRQRLFPVQALNALVVHYQPFAAQQQIDPGAPETPAFLGQLPQALAPSLVAVWRHTPECPAVEVDQLTSPPPGVAVRFDDLARSLAAKGGRGPP
jgi:hypothetical protein